MVYISRLTLKGFKSFPQRPVSIQFENGMNSITGPNGSGKSNIIDAIRFVLGENSPKNLRHSKMSDIIYDQSKEENPYARVSLTLENNDKSLPVEEERVIATRELRKNGESAYYINSRRMSRNQYLEILSAAHISYDGMNIIAQGTIQRLAELTPDEKRGAVEQFLGLKHFDEKKAEAMARLREADNELAISFAKLDERREAIERLQKERNDALRYRQVKHEISRIRKAIILKDIDRIDTSIEELRKRLGELSSQKAAAEASIAKLQEEKKQLELQRDEYYTAKVAGPNKRLTEIGLSISKLENEMYTLDQRKKELLSLKTKLDEAIPRLTDMMKNAEQERDSLLSHIDDLKSRIRERNEKLTLLSSQAESLRQERLITQKELAKYSTKDAILQGRILVLESKERDIAARIAETDKLISDMQVELQELSRKQEDLTGMTNLFKEKVEELGRAIPTEAEEVRQLELQIENAKNQKKKLSKELADAEQILNESFRTVARYSSGLELAERFFGSELNIRKIEEIAETGAIEGFHGVLSSLIDYQKKYSNAVRAAAQEWLNSFVVDDLNGLLQIASLAKKLKTGRVRILPLSEIEGIPEPEAPLGSGVLGRLSEYVECEPRFRPAVDFVFGNFILTSSAKTAFLLSRSGYRCVTIAGDIFEPKGSAMETGYLSEVSLKQVGLTDPESIKMAEESLKALKESLDRRRKNLERLDRLQAELEEKRFEKSLRIREEESNLKTYRSFVKRYENLAARVTRKGEYVRKKLELAGKRREHLVARINRIEEIKTDLAARRSSLGTEEMRRRLQEIDGRLSSTSQEIEQLSSEISTLNAEVSGFEARLNGEVAPRINQLSDSLRKSEQELKSLQEELPRIDARLPQIEEEVKRLAEEEKVVREEDERALPRLKELEQLIGKKEEQIASEQQRILRIDREVLKVEGNVQAHLQEKQKLEAEVSSLGIAEDVYYSTGFDILLQDLMAEEEELRNSVNLLAPQTYQEAYISYRNASERRNELERDRNAIVSFVNKVEAEKREAFMKAFERIDREVRSIFQMLTGGEAWLELENPDDPFSGGIFLMAKFPKGTARESSSLSGGEKAIVAVAFLLAFQSIYPSGFYLMDEVDAALDPVYAQGLGNLLAEWSKKAQIIVISFKESVVEKATNIVGVYMAGGSSNVVRLKKEEALGVRAEQG
ncbi:MAG: chromosome segregation SMC family protein [Conexivisphaerales archaeon]